MAYRYNDSDSNEKHSPSEEAQKPPYSSEYDHGVEIIRGRNGSLADPTNVGQSLHRGLSARQITMIAIGGAIGTGLIIGTGQALARSGPASILISYSVVGVLCYAVMTALGEMATWMPAAGGFAAYATRFVDPALGFSLGYTYWFKYIIITPNQLTAAALVIQYWAPPEQINPGVFIAIFLVVIIAINYLGIRFFGEIEFWLSSVKVLTILGLIILCIILAAGGGPNSGGATGFQYYHDPGAFATYIGSGSVGRFTGFWSSFTNAVFAYLGTELIGVTVAEAQNPRRNIPRAIKLTFWRILVFYIFLVFLLGLIVPYDSNLLAFATEASTSAAASPFVVAIRIAGIKVLPGFFNACVLIFVFSASNSDLYIATRTLHGLAVKGQAPRIFAKTDNRGVPYYSLGLCALIACIAFLNVANDSADIFSYFVNLVSIFGLLTWISILVSHIYFIKAREAQGVRKEDLRYVSPFGYWGSVVALAFCILVALTKNFAVFTYSEDYGNFDYKNFITGYLGIPLYLMMIFGYKLVFKTKGLKPHEADLFGGKAVIDADEQEWLVKEAEEKANGKGPSTIYRHTLGYLF
ncbi:amino acid transporter [Vermiconidia calcicola]|uniref:Amino acid transporter n=1 Tax=Vermiconidia calcicola TaxID=1690605 RepID=A0ACC3N934_9PEZI|nr:amino acid transporter [Vermiconidia calcicola]